MQNKKGKGKYSGGRPKKEVDQVKLMDINRTGLSVRKATEVYNSDLPRKGWISKSTMAQALSGLASRLS